MKKDYLWGTISICSLIGAITLTAAQSNGAMITGLFNTGVDGNGNVLPLHAQEQHYTVTGASTEAYVVPRVYHGPGTPAWVTAPAGSAWIGPNTTESTWPSDPIGVYNYALRITVDLTGYNLAQAQISGLWATDNSGEIWLNGLNTGFTTADWGFTALSPFLIQTGFREGVNSLEFRVYNSTSTANPSGLLVAGLRGVDDGTLEMPAVPEPSTIISGALLLLPFVVGAARRGRKAKRSEKN